MSIQATPDIWVQLELARRAAVGRGSLAHYRILCTLCAMGMYLQTFSMQKDARFCLCGCLSPLRGGLATPTDASSSTLNTTINRCRKRIVIVYYLIYTNLLVNKALNIIPKAQYVAVWCVSLSACLCTDDSVKMLELYSGGVISRVADNPPKWSSR